MSSVRAGAAAATIDEMRWSALALLAAGCSTAQLAESSTSVGNTLETISGTGDSSSSGAPASEETGVDPTSLTTSDPTVDPETGTVPTGDPSTGESSTSGADTTDSTGAVESSSEGSSSESSTGGPDPLLCTDGDLGQAVGNAVASGTTAGAVDDLTLGCGGGGGLDAIYVWSAPAAGQYTFDLSASGYDTAMALFDPTCDGTEIICSDDDIGLTTEITRNFAAAEQVLVVIDGYQGATGSYVLDINAGTGLDLVCADGGDLGHVLGNVDSGSTAGANDTWPASCQNSDGPDVTMVWTAPASDSYTFATAGSGFDTILTLWSPDCGGSQLACNDDFDGTLQSSITTALDAGETVLVVVDGYNNQSGNYMLSID